MHTATHTSKVPHTQLFYGTHDSQDIEEPTCKLITYRVCVGSSDRKVSWLKKTNLKNQHNREETKNSQTMRSENEHSSFKCDRQFWIFFIDVNSP